MEPVFRGVMPVFQISHIKRANAASQPCTAMAVAVIAMVIQEDVVVWCVCTTGIGHVFRVGGGGVRAGWVIDVMHCHACHQLEHECGSQYKADKPFHHGFMLSGLSLAAKCRCVAGVGMAACSLNIVPVRVECLGRSGHTTGVYFTSHVVWVAVLAAGILPESIACKYVTVWQWWR